MTLLTLAQDGQRAGLQVQVLKVEAAQFAAAQAQVEGQAQDGPIPSPLGFVTSCWLGAWVSKG